MSRTALLYHPLFLEHDAGPGHPERAARLQAIMERLERGDVASRCIHPVPNPAPLEAITRIHASTHVAHVADLSGLGRLVAETPDTLISPATYEAAVLATGAVLGAVDVVVGGKADNAFCVVRPPGHHAEFDQALGFCYFNNIAIAARYLQARHGLARIAVVDWDVHHGNGTQHSFEGDSAIFYFSVHQFSRGFFPGTGAADERGTGQGLGTTRNAPLPPGATEADYLRIFREQLRPAMDEFRPQFILVSAGFDAHGADPLGGMELSEGSFARLTRELCALAGDHCGGRLVSVLEGGYDLTALAASAEQHVQVLLG